MHFKTFNIKLFNKRLHLQCGFNEKKLNVFVFNYPAPRSHIHSKTGNSGFGRQREL